MAEGDIPTYHPVKIVNFSGDVHIPKPFLLYKDKQLLNHTCETPEELAECYVKEVNRADGVGQISHFLSYSTPSGCSMATVGGVITKIDRLSPGDIERFEKQVSRALAGK